MNILKTEYLQESAGSKTFGTGEWELRNGVWSMRVSPAPFWGGSETYGDPQFKGALRGRFAANTQYMFNFYADADNSYYDVLDINVPGGFTIVYTDNTREGLLFSGNIKSPIGWQHISFVSDPSKTIDALGVYYYTNTPIYYRYDSYISPVVKNNFDKQGIVTTATLSEEYDSKKSSLYTAGIAVNNFYEY